MYMINRDVVGLEPWHLASDCAGAVFATCDQWQGKSLFWFNDGLTPRADIDAYGDADEPMAAFVLAHPDAPAEALWRFAAGQKFHGGDPDGFRAASFAQRTAYQIFVAVVPVAARLMADVAAEFAPAPQSAPPRVVDRADTVFEPVAGPLDRLDAAPVMIDPATGAPPPPAEVQTAAATTGEADDGDAEGETAAGGEATGAAEPKLEDAEAGAEPPASRGDASDPAGEPDAAGAADPAAGEALPGALAGAGADGDDVRDAAEQGAVAAATPAAEPVAMTPPAKPAKRGKGG